MNGQVVRRESRANAPNGRVASVLLSAAACACILLALTTAETARATVVGFIGQSYTVQGSPARSIVDPTVSGPESKLWYHDGRWWGALWDSGSGSHHIFWLDRSTPNHPWVDTNVAVDGRNTARVDVLTAGPKLYVAAHVYDFDSGRGRALLYRYSYRPGSQTYTRDRGFPVRINSSRSKTLVIAKERGSRVLWATWVEAVTPGKREVLVARGLNGGKEWGAPFRIPHSRTVGFDDVSSIVPFGKSVGVLWSDQNNGDGNRFRFAVHRNGARASRWSSESPYLSGRRMVDDHISLKAYDGRVLAVVKTASRGIDKDGPVLVLLVREANGTWQHYGVASNSSELMRPILVIDADAKVLHVFANGPDWKAGTIFEKEAPLDSPSFTLQGPGEAFISDDAAPGLKAATSTKQNVTSAMGIVVLAGNELNNTYYHGEE